MEAVTNIVIGLVVSTIANWLILPTALGVSMTLGQNVLIGLAFTAISLVRSYVIRRAFNGRSVWTAIRGVFPRYWYTPIWDGTQTVVKGWSRSLRKGEYVLTLERRYKCPEPS